MRFFSRPSFSDPLLLISRSPFNAYVLFTERESLMLITEIMLVQNNLMFVITF